MEEKEYVDKRLNDQINWYDKESVFNQKMYKILVLIEILFSGSIPFLIPYANNNTPIIKIIIGVMGIIIALIAGVMNLYKFQENWINYRTTAESLKHEKYLYLTKSGIYNINNKIDTPLNNLVTRIESIISKENTKWFQQIKKMKNDKKL